jgi:prepilin-type N-terminal cleavage/methylation domain-containing protein
MNNRAFTLLELLVVITIIGILASIVVVSMSGSTDSATIAKGKAYAQQVHALLGANAVGVWNFDEGAGTTLTDISGYGNNGTLNKGANGTGLDWVASDIEGTALQFDGMDDYVIVIDSPSISPTSAITVSLWYKGNEVFPGKGPLTKGNYDYMIYFTGTTIGNESVSFYIKDSEGTTDTSGSYFFAYNDNVWHQYIGVFDSDWIRLYIDGELVSSKNSVLTNIRNSSGDLKIGYAWAGYTSAFMLSPFPPPKSRSTTSRG